MDKRCANEPKIIQAESLSIQYCLPVERCMPLIRFTGRWSCRDSPVGPHVLRGRPFLDLRLKFVKIGSPSPALS